MAADEPERAPEDNGGVESLPIGQRLRAGRERVGLSEAQIAQSLNLDQSVVIALEAGDFDSLGAPIFVKGHLRNYARLVKLDPVAIVADYEALERGAAPALQTQVHHGVRMDESSGWGSRIAWLVLALIVAAIGWWLYQNHELSGLRQIAHQPQQGGTVQPLPSTLNAAPAAQSHAVVPLAQSKTAAAQGARAGVGQPATQAPPTIAGSAAGKSTNAVTQPPAAKQPATAAVTPTPENKKAQVPAADVPNGLPLALRLTGDSWVEVDDANGKRLYYGLAHGGQTLYLNGEPPLHVFLGNAPNVRVLTAGNVIDTKEYTRSDDTARFTIRKLGDNPPFADNPSSP
ncbi:MAG TPA: RodZ domain-containing protein [Gammaproteobacteria bacterium]|nr:RodZ domain-containing protein [Gammaproteobacteria bacterium]